MITHICDNCGCVYGHHRCPVCLIPCTEEKPTEYRREVTTEYLAQLLFKTAPTTPPKEACEWESQTVFSKDIYRGQALRILQEVIILIRPKGC